MAQTMVSPSALSRGDMFLRSMRRLLAKDIGAHVQAKVRNLSYGLKKTVNYTDNYLQSATSLPIKKEMVINVSFFFNQTFE